MINRSTAMTMRQRAEFRLFLEHGDVSGGGIDHIGAGMHGVDVVGGEDRVAVRAGHVAFGLGLLIWNICTVKPSTLGWRASARSPGRWISLNRRRSFLPSRASLRSRTGRMMLLFPCLAFQDLAFWFLPEIWILW